MKAVKAFYSLLFIALAAVLLSSITGAPLPLTGGGLLALSCIPQAKGVAFMGLQKEIWVADIIGNLFKNNEFAKRSVDMSAFVEAGTIVHMPAAGSPSAVKMNLTVFPQAATQRADNDLPWVIDTAYALPRHIKQIDKYELSYDKRQSVMGEDQRNMIDKAMSNMLYRWSPAVGNVIETDGAATANNGIDATATGNRKKFTKAAFPEIRKRLKVKDLTGRLTALLTAVDYADFFESLDSNEKTAFNNVADLANGIIGRYYGFDIMERSSVARYRKVGGIYTPVNELDENFTPDAADSSASLFWEESSVVRAMGEVDVFEDTKNPLYFGDIYSSLLRFGGRIRRQVGMYAVVQAAAA